MSTSDVRTDKIKTASSEGISLSKQRSIIRAPGNGYKFILWFHDLTLMTLAFWGGLLLFGSYRLGDGAPMIIAGLMTLTPIVFFHHHNLYDFHFVFNIKRHALDLIQSFFLSLCTLGTVTLVMAYYAKMGLWPLIFTILCLAGVTLIVSRIYYEQALNIIRVLGISLALLGLIGILQELEVLVPPDSWWWALAGYLSAAAVVLLTRLLLVHQVLNRWLRRRFRRQVLVVGSDADAAGIANHLIRHNAPFWIAGNVGTCSLTLDRPKSCFGGLDALPELIEEQNIQEIVVTDPAIGKRELVEVLDLCTSNGVTAWFLPKLMPVINLKIRGDLFCGIELIKLCAQRNTWLVNKAKHFIDAVVSLPAVFFALPLFGLFAAAIKVNSAGPVFYRARTIGKAAREFTMYKFRTMYADTDNSIHKAYVTDLIEGKIGREDGSRGALKITDDPRVTRVGKFLRKTSLDELPQLINVLKADMSLVGPRPCLPYEYEVYKDWHKKRTAVRPGITGLWQVTGRSEVAFDDMILLDLYYIYNRSLLLDFQIMYETVFAVLAKKGAY
jgi:undecaprenyl-phosphate galactose phosphotransferase